MGPWHKKRSRIPLLKSTGYWLLAQLVAAIPHSLPPAHNVNAASWFTCPRYNHNASCCAAHQLTDSTVRPFSTANTKAHHWAQPRARSIQCGLPPSTYQADTAHVSGSQVLKLYIGGAAVCPAVKCTRDWSLVNREKPGQGSRKHSCKFCTIVRHTEHKEPYWIRTTVHAQRLLHSGGAAPLFINVGTRWRWVVSFTLRPPALYPLYSKLAGSSTP